jgi:sugar phosphate isomerase/epimerase
MLPLGIAARFGGYNLPMEKRLELIAQAGFNTTFLWLDEAEDMVRDGRADDVPGLVRQHGLKLDNIHASFRHSNLLWSESRADNEIIRRECETALYFCGKHSIPYAVMHVTFGFTPPPQNQTGIDIIHSLVTKAEGLGVTIALENLKRPDYLEPIFQEIKSDNLGFCYDCSQDFLDGQSRGRILKKWGKRLVTTHISDAKGAGGEHLQLGEGTIDWNTFAEVFPRGSYKGVLMAEIAKHAQGLSAISFLKMEYLKLREIAALLVK